MRGYHSGDAPLHPSALSTPSCSERATTRGSREHAALFLVAGQHRRLVRACIHRGASQVGGSCVELEHAGQRLVLDVGAPLDAGLDESDLALPPVAGLTSGDAKGSSSRDPEFERLTSPTIPSSASTPMSPATGPKRRFPPLRRSATPRFSRPSPRRVVSASRARCEVSSRIPPPASSRHRSVH